LNSQSYMLNVNSMYVQFHASFRTKVLDEFDSFFSTFYCFCLLIPCFWSTRWSAPHPILRNYYTCWLEKWKILITFFEFFWGQGGFINIWQGNAGIVYSSISQARNKINFQVNRVNNTPVSRVRIKPDGTNRYGKKLLSSRTCNIHACTRFPSCANRLPRNPRVYVSPTIFEFIISPPRPLVVRTYALHVYRSTSIDREKKNK